MQFQHQIGCGVNKSCHRMEDLLSSQIHTQKKKRTTQVSEDDILNRNPKLAERSILAGVKPH